MPDLSICQFCWTNYQVQSVNNSDWISNCENLSESLKNGWAFSHCSKQNLGLCSCMSYWCHSCIRFYLLFARTPTHSVVISQPRLCLEPAAAASSPPTCDGFGSCCPPLLHGRFYSSVLYVDPTSDHFSITNHGHLPLPFSSEAYNILWKNKRVQVRKMTLSWVCRLEGFFLWPFPCQCRPKRNNKSDHR